MMVQRHWWNGSTTTRSRRDVFIRSDGRRWDVLVRIGGAPGRSRVQDCPSGSAAAIVAGAWRGSEHTWREVQPPLPV
ncbi:hypothetical protein J3R04_004087 [Spirilliplanes yamanashiensis]|nr:hypothetical protein [Spirilliplanes yamanashiensis]